MGQHPIGPGASRKPSVPKPLYHQDTGRRMGSLRDACAGSPEHIVLMPAEGIPGPSTIHVLQAPEQPGIYLPPSLCLSMRAGTYSLGVGEGV